MTHPSIIRLDPFAETSAWPDIPAETLAEGAGRQKGKAFFEDAACGLSVFLRETEAHVTSWAPAPHTTLYILISGDIAVLERAHSTVLKPGEAMIVPQGVNCSQRYTTACRFFALQVTSRSNSAPPGPLTVMRIHKKISLSPLAPPPRELMIGAPPQQRARTYFETPAGDVRIGVWESTPYARRPVSAENHELMRFIHGEVTFTDAEGGEHIFKAGETAFVPRGTRNAWTSREPVRKIYASITAIA